MEGGETRWAAAERDPAAAAAQLLRGNAVDVGNDNLIAHAALAPHDTEHNGIMGEPTRGIYVNVYACTMVR